MMLLSRIMGGVLFLLCMYYIFLLIRNNRNRL